MVGRLRCELFAVGHGGMRAAHFRTAPDDCSRAFISEAKQVLSAAQRGQTIRSASSGQWRVDVPGERRRMNRRGCGHNTYLAANLRACARCTSPATEIGLDEFCGSRMRHEYFLIHGTGTIGRLVH